ncbi:MAG: hypothetical protein ACK528_10060 [Alphaproteobacteria bacterium]
MHVGTITTAAAVSDERKQLAAELLPHLATIMRLSRPATGTVASWLAVVQSMGLTLKDLMDEVKRQELEIEFAVERLQEGQQ